MQNMNFSGIFRQISEYIIFPESIIAVVGAGFLGYWLLKTSLGRESLADSIPRRNNMPLYLPFLPLLIYIGFLPAAVEMTTLIMGDMPKWQEAFVENLVTIGGAIAITVIIVFLARASFARRLKGFGLNPRTIGKDFGIAAINYLAVWPVVMVMVILTIEAGKLFIDPDFKMEQHREIEFLTKHQQLPLMISVLFSAVIISPIFEEMIFRGLLQSMLRSFTKKAWLSIIITSVFFVSTHKNLEHWPALFVLSVGMGYSYEKSGSLFRPIFIHAFFNAVNIVSNLT
jgi:membrane protease YdiL (CAAX protease family)